MSPRRQATVREQLDAIAKRRARLDPFNAKSIAMFATNESFAADVPREVQDAWAELARDARAAFNAKPDAQGGAR